MPKPENVGAKYVRHSREDVVAAALDILDQHGLPDLTMRRLGATLDVQPSALYWHFANKQTLLASIADQIVERARPVPHSSGGWKGATRAEAYALRDALLAFRDGAEVVSSTLALGLGAGLPNRPSDAYQVRWSIPIGPRRLLPFSPRTSQRNRNELGEATVNKT